MRPEVAFPLFIVVLLIVAPIAAFAFTRKRIKTGSKLKRTLNWSLRIASLLPWFCTLVLLAWLAATSRDYDPDVTKWIEIKRPKDPHYADVANEFDYQWIVSQRDNKMYAHLVGWREVLKWLFVRPPFVPRAINPETAQSFADYKAVHVLDGWLVGFNEGEFGAALYWFSNDGLRNYKISDDQVVEFMNTPQGILAIQGLAHLGFNFGSLIQIAKDPKTGRWTSIELKSLPEEPQSFLRLSDGRLFIVLYSSLVLLNPDDRLETLAKSINWTRADTIVASPDATRIYVGTTPYVCEYNMQTKQLRYLVPDSSLAERLSKVEDNREE